MTHASSCSHGAALAVSPDTAGRQYLFRIVYVDTVAFQQRAQLGEMFLVPRFDCA